MIFVHDPIIMGRVPKVMSASRQIRAQCETSSVNEIFVYVK